MRNLIASYGIAEAITKGLNIALTLSLAAFVNLDSYGSIAILIAIELVLTELIIVGQHTAMLRFHQAYRSALSNLYSACLMLVFLSTCAVLLLYGLLPLHEWKIISFNIHDRDVIFLIIGVALQCHVALYLAYLRASDQVWEYGVLRVGYQLSKVLAVGGAVLLLRNASAYPIGVLAVNAAFFLLVAPRINRRTRGYANLGRFSPTALKQNILIGVPLTAHAVVGVLYAVTDRFFLERMLDQKQVAIYNFAFVQGTAIFFITNVLALAFVPRIYRGQEYNGETARMLFEFLRASLLGALALSVVVYLLVYPISTYFVDPQYQEGKVVLLLALAAALVNPVSHYGLYKLTLLRSVLGVPFITVGMLVFNITLNMLLIPRYGIEGAAAAALLSELLYGIAMVMVAHMIARRPRIRKS